MDLFMFRAAHLHNDLGLNVAIVVQPLHGPRRAGARSGDRVLYGGAMNMIHTTAQAAYDTRRLLSWLRASQGGTTAGVGIQGVSLGGYVTALVASLDGDLRCAIAGIPESDIVRGLRRSVEPRLPPFYEQWGLSWVPLERVSRVTSPIALAPLVPQDRRHIYAGLADRWVRPGNVADLWKHWGNCDIHWFRGSHLSSFIEPSVRRYVDSVLRQALPVSVALNTG